MESEHRRALHTWLRDHLGAQVEILETTPLTGGAIQENWRLDLHVDARTLSLVLRTDAPSSLEVSRSRRQEHALLLAAHHAGVTVPEPLAFCTDLGVLGRPFLLMTHVSGTATGHKLARHAHPGLAHSLGRELGAIHSIRPGTAGLEFLGTPPQDPHQDRIDRYRSYLDALPGTSPTLEFALRWLERHPAPTSPTALCHMDFRNGNLMIDGDTLTGVLDWEFAEWGDPMEDLGYLCARCWRFGAWEREVGGLGDRQDLYDGYRDAGGHVSPDAVTWFELLATVRWAVVARQQAARHDQDPSLFLALTGRMLPELELDILDLIDQWVTP